MTGKTAFVTNVMEYAGPPVATALAEQGWRVFCHDDSFSSATSRKHFENQNPGCIAATAAQPAAYVTEGLEHLGRIDTLISNDIPRHLSSDPWSKKANAPGKTDDQLEDFETFLDSLAIAPVRLLRAALPTMKAAKSGSIIFITSGAPLRVPVVKRRPHGYLAARAAANTLVKALAVELAPLNIPVNAVAPFLVYSQTFFPSPLGAEDPEFETVVNRMVPMQRFGKPEEIGALVAFLASGKSTFVSGQVIAFSGAGC